ncbi:MAG: hypothetical protein ACREUL_18640 [Steroidobacteraceae bacterium]
MSIIPNRSPSRESERLPPFPSHVLEVLRAEGITSLGAWAHLSRRARNSIFGLPPSRVRELDAAAARTG